jgi:hypothetical protein
VQLVAPVSDRAATGTQRAPELTLLARLFAPARVDRHLEDREPERAELDHELDVEGRPSDAGPTHAAETPLCQLPSGN